MRKIRCGFMVLLLTLCCSATSVPAQVSIGIGLPNVSIGINLPLFPELVPVPGYPVYYAPRVNANYFFYDGMYWVYLDDYWYSSYWYNGPWSVVEPLYVPAFILRVPVRYYTYPPPYFRGWRPDAPPRWGQHWGRGWEQQRRGWDKWKHGTGPARAPLPVYQRQYTGDRYPRQVEQQQELRRQHYKYQPRDKEVRQHFQRGEHRAPARQERREEPRMRGSEQREMQRPGPPQATPQQQGPAYQERRQEQRQQPGPAQYERQAPRPQGQEQRYQQRERQHEPQGQGQRYEGRERQQEPRGQGQGRREEERGRDRN